ncbi:MAG: alcohol dehydrogenase class IV, partial [Gammaproteobacteria bacterium]
KNPISDMLAREALSLLANNIETAVHNGSDIQARQNMLLGAMIAGQAFANSPVAAVHALAYPLGGHFHIPHGLSNSLVLPYVLRFNAEAAAGQYAELAAIILGDKLVAGTAQEATEQLIAGMVELIEKVGLPARLRDMDIPEDFLPTLASDAMLQQRLLINNPVDVTEADALAIYTAAY